MSNPKMALWQVLFTPDDGATLYWIADATESELAYLVLRPHTLHKRISADRLREVLLLDIENVSSTKFLNFVNKDSLA